MVRITIEELKKQDTIVLHVEKRNSTKMERLVEREDIKEITRFLTKTGKD